MIEQKKVPIGKTEYVVQELNFTEGAFWTATLTQLASGLMLGVGKFPTGGIESLDMHIGQAVHGIANHMHANDFVRLCKKLYKDSVIVPEYDDKDFEQRFAGAKGQDEFFQLITEIVKFNHADLWPTLKKTIAFLTGISWPDETDPTSEQ